MDLDVKRAIDGRTALMLALNHSCIIAAGHMLRSGKASLRFSDKYGLSVKGRALQRGPLIIFFWSGIRWFSGEEPTCTIAHQSVEIEEQLARIRKEKHMMLLYYLISSSEEVEPAIVGPKSLRTSSFEEIDGPDIHIDMLGNYDSPYN